MKDPQRILLPVAEISASKGNPRGRFDAAAQAELTESIRAHGVLQPIVVRPKGKRFELVAGERRLRSAQALKLDTIPASVVELTDDEAAEVALVENLQREDLHPMDEAVAYGKLQEEHKLSVEDLAAKAGKSASYVRQRLRLLVLAPEVRTAFWEGKVSTAVAMILTRIEDHNLQKRAAKEAIGGQPHYPGASTRRERMSTREVSNMVARQYLVSLDRAPFDKGHEGLNPGAGPCTTCPKRGGAQLEIFSVGAASSDDSCGDPSCFAAKREAWWVLQERKAAEKGWQIKTGRAAELMLGETNTWSGRYVPLADACHDDPKERPWARLLGKLLEGLPVTLCQDRTGAAVEIVPYAEALSALAPKYAWAKKRKAVVVSRSTRSSGLTSAQKASKAKEATEHAIRRRILEDVNAGAHPPLKAEVLRLILAALLNALWSPHRKALYSLWGWKLDAYGSPKSRLGKMGAPDLARALVVASVVHGVESPNTGLPKDLVAVARLAKVNVAAIKRELAEKAKAKPKGKAATKAKPKGKAATKAKLKPLRGMIKS